MAISTGYGDKAFYFLRASSGPPGDDADLCIGKIGKSYNGRFDKTKYPNHSKCSRHKKSEELMTERIR
jgi:hypothetical protein